MRLSFNRVTIRAKLMLLGLGCVFMTALSLGLAGVWQGSLFGQKAAQEALNLVNADLDHITENVYNLIKSQDDATQQKINHDLNVARYVLKQSGQIYLSTQTVPWKAVNQYTKEVKEINLPKMMVGGRWLGQNKQMWKDTPVVDQVKRLVGDTCTIFQRISPEGDMLRVATNVEIRNGIRAIGTYIPAIDPDGKPIPVIATVMNDDTYRGASYAVNSWHITAYEPIYDQDEQIIGVLHVGVKNDNIAALRRAIMQLKIGKSGYVFILGGRGNNRGHYIISKNGRRDGENLWNQTDASGRPFIQSIVNKALACKPGEFDTERYTWINPGEAAPRQKIARLAYYAPWDWVIGASAYEDEINQSTLIFSQGYKSMMHVFGVVAAVVALLGGLATWLFARNMSNTVKVVTQAATKMTHQDLPRLVRTMDAVNQGDLSVTFEFDKDLIAVSSSDELGTMAGAFNRMNRALVNVGNAFTTMVANLRDLTGLLELKVAERTSKLEESERNLSSIIDFLPDATLVIDRDGRVIAWNRTMELMTGVKSDDILGKGNFEYAIPFFGCRRPILIDMVLNPDDEMEKHYDSFRREGNTLYAETKSDRLKDEDVYIFAAASALYDTNGHVVGAIETLRDITGWKMIEKELIQARSDAEEATKAKSDFLANMSHEIRTPMNGVLGMTSLLLDTPLNDEQAEYARTVQSSADALLTVINDILDFSKIEAGKLDFEDLDFDLRLALDEIAELASIKADEKGIEFANYVHPNVPSLLIGDPGRLRQVLLNMATNAIKFTHSGDVVVEVSLVNESEDRAELHFSVKDTGIGIPKDRLNRLFRSFSQVDSSTTRKFGGTGLGLAISKRLVEMMQGEIGVESEEGKGSTFWFTVALKKQTESATKNESCLMPEDIQGKRILAVDDNETNRKLIHAYLKSWQCHATVVHSGPDAMEMMKSAAEKGHGYDMAIIDFMMPEMDGEALGRAIKFDPMLEKTHMVLLTSRGMRGDAARARSVGFDAYLTKPIKQSQLFDAVLTVFGKQNMACKENEPAIVTKHSIAETYKKKVKILLTEDNPVNQKVALIHMRKFGYTADVANNGREAVEAINSGHYDLVLMDVQMPEMDGHEASRTIRANGHDLPIIAMTANAMKGDREKCLASGMDDYISKPVNPKLLLEKIQRWSPTEAEVTQRNNQFAN